MSARGGRAGTYVAGDRLARRHAVGTVPVEVGEPRLTVHVPPIDPLLGGACGDVAAARSAAAVLLEPVHSNGVDLDHARLILTAVQARLERVVLSDLAAALEVLRDPDYQPFAGSPMQFLQYADAELMEMSFDARCAALGACVQALTRTPRD